VLWSLLLRGVGPCLWVAPSSSSVATDKTLHGGTVASHCCSLPCSTALGPVVMSVAAISESLELPVSDELR